MAQIRAFGNVADEAAETKKKKSKKEKRAKKDKEASASAVEAKKPAPAATQGGVTDCCICESPPSFFLLLATISNDSFLFS